MSARPGPRPLGGDGGRGSLDPPRRSPAHTFCRLSDGAAAANVEGVRVGVQDARSRVVGGCEKREYVNAGPEDI